MVCCIISLAKASKKKYDKLGLSAEGGGEGKRGFEGPTCYMVYFLKLKWEEKKFQNHIKGTKIKGAGRGFSRGSAKSPSLSYIF